MPKGTNNKVILEALNTLGINALTLSQYLFHNQDKLLSKDFSHTVIAHFYAEAIQKCPSQEIIQAKDKLYSFKPKELIPSFNELISASKITPPSFSPPIKKTTDTLFKSRETQKSKKISLTQLLTNTMTDLSNSPYAQQLKPFTVVIIKILTSNNPAYAEIKKSIENRNFHELLQPKIAETLNALMLEGASYNKHFWDNIENVLAMTKNKEDDSSHSETLGNPAKQSL